MPTPLGKSFTCRVYVDSDHAGDQVTRRSRTGFIVFLNSAPIYWSSKKQTSCETSTYGSELLAMKQATEFVRGLRYKLRMMGIPVDEPAFVFRTTNLFLQILQTQGLPSRRSVIVLRIILCTRAARGMSGVPPTSRQRKILRIY